MAPQLFVELVSEILKTAADTWKPRDTVPLLTLSTGFYSDVLGRLLCHPARPLLPIVFGMGVQHWFISPQVVGSQNQASSCISSVRGLFSDIILHQDAENRTYQRYTFDGSQALEEGTRQKLLSIAANIKIFNFANSYPKSVVNAMKWLVPKMPDDWLSPQVLHICLSTQRTAPLSFCNFHQLVRLYLVSGRLDDPAPVLNLVPTTGIKEVALIQPSRRTLDVLFPTNVGLSKWTSLSELTLTLFDPQSVPWSALASVSGLHNLCLQAPVAPVHSSPVKHAPPSLHIRSLIVDVCEDTLLYLLNEAFRLPKLVDVCVILTHHPSTSAPFAAVQQHLLLLPDLIFLSVKVRTDKCALPRTILSQGLPPCELQVGNKVQAILVDPCVLVVPASGLVVDQQQARLWKSPFRIHWGSLQGCEHIVRERAPFRLFLAQNVVPVPDLNPRLYDVWVTNSPPTIRTWLGDGWEDWDGASVVSQRGFSLRVDSLGVHWVPSISMDVCGSSIKGAVDHILSYITKERGSHWRKIFASVDNK